MKASSVPTSSYRAEIDGMRAIAVVAVIVYHLQIPSELLHPNGTFLTGGFLGVDLFFVLSGYLITGILLDEHLRTGRIDFLQFYWRRAKRILPPLILVILASLPVAWLILLPTELERLAWSIVSTLLFVSNGFWFFELSEYGAQSGLLQPFLHTWSLAIEEQFYLVFPPLLLLSLSGGRNTAFVLVLVCLVLGLGLAQATTQKLASFSFFSPTSRAWELLAGVALAFAAQMKPGALRGGILDRLVPPVSLMVLFLCFLTCQISQMVHPGFFTALVVMATCGLIWFATPGEAVTRALSCGPMVAIGKLSYSLYLWHFPIFAFGRLLTLGEPDVWDMLIWLLLTVAFSYLGYVAIETPFRTKATPRVFAVTSSGALLPLMIFVVVATNGIGQTARLEPLQALYGSNEIDNTVLADASWSLLDAASPDEDIANWNALKASETEKSVLWFSDRASSRVLIVGDSHAKDVYNAFVQNAGVFPGREFARFNLHRATLTEDLALLRRSPNFKEADTIIVAPRYYRGYRDALTEILNVVSGRGADIIVLGPAAEFDIGGSLPLFDWYLRQTQEQGALSRLNGVAPRYEDQTQKRRETVVRAISENAGASFLSRRSLMCDDVAGECTLVTRDGLKSMYDSSHWTLAGAREFGKRAAAAGWLEP